MSFRQKNNAAFLLFTLFFALFPCFKTLALSDKALSLIDELKNKPNVESPLEKPADPAPGPDLNAPPPVLPPPAPEPTPEPAAPEITAPAKPAPVAASPGEMQTGDPDKAPAPKQKSRKSRKTKDEKKLSEETEKGTPTKASPPSLRSSEASELIKRIMEKLDATRQSIAGKSGQESKAKPVVPPTAIQAPKVAETTPAALPPSSVTTPTSAGNSSGQRSFGELTDEELIQYAKDHVWSSEKSRRHNPPPTPPTKKKKKVETVKPAVKVATPAPKAGTPAKSPGKK